MFLKLISRILNIDGINKNQIINKKIKSPQVKYLKYYSSGMQNREIINI